MSVYTVGTFVLCLFFSTVLIAGNGSAQNVKEVVVSVYLEEATIPEVFEAIESQTVFSFLYNRSEVERMNRRLTLEHHSATVEQVLIDISAKTGAQFRQSGRTIAADFPEEVAEPFFTDLFQETVTGRVTDAETGEALPGVTIMIKNTDSGTATDVDGEFELTVPSLNDVLVVSSIGYQTHEVPINGRSVIELTMQPDIIAGEELVVVGYGTRERATLTGSVAQISVEELQTTTSSDAVNMMAGKLPGLRVAQKTGEPGDFGVQFDIRGMGQPLVVVDGVPTRANFRGLDPNEIEDIAILKDASAAVYGVRAANGVIVVTTKRGRQQRPRLTYSSSVGIAQFTNTPETLNAYEAALLKNEADFNSGLRTPRFNQEQLENFRNGATPSTDWLSLAIRDYAPQVQQNLSLSGGTEGVQYYVSFGHFSEQGMWDTGDLNYQRYNFRSNVTVQITDNLEAELLLNGIRQVKNEPGESTFTILKTAWMQDPTIPVYANNNPNYLSNVPGTWHPLASTNRDISGYRERDDKAFTGILAFNYDVPFVEGVRARAMFSHDRGHIDDKRWSKKHALYDYNSVTDTYNPVFRFDPSTLSQSFYERTESILMTSIHYNSTFIDVHNVEGLLLFEQRQLQDQSVSGSRQFTMDVCSGSVLCR